jgi:O-antigen/teichoic acid export membrane protein
MEAVKNYSGRRVAGNAVVLVVGRLITAPLSLLQVGMLARYLGVANYGAYVFLFSYLGIFGFLCDFGINQILVREQSKSDMSVAGEFLLSGFLAKLLFSFVGVLIALLVYPIVVPSNFGRAGLYLASLLLLSAAFNSFATVFDVHLRGEVTAATNLVSTLLLCLATWGAIKWHAGLLGLISLNILFGFPSLSSVLPGVATVAALTFFSRKFWHLRWKLDLKRIVAIVRESSALGASLVLVALATRADSVLLTRMRGTEQMGFYAAVIRLADIVLVIPAFLAASILPKFSSEFPASKERFMQSVRRSGELISIVGTLSFLFFFICAHPLILFIFGERFAPSAIGLKIIAMLVWLMMANGMLSTAAVSSGHQKLNLWCAGVAFCSSLVLNVLLIPRFGFLGTCLARVTTEFAVFLVALIYLGSAYGKGFGSPVTLVGISVMGIVVVLDYVFPIEKVSSIVLEASLAMAVYMYVLYKFRPLRLHELRGVTTF